MAIDLLTPLLDEGIRNPNFFEGRLLTAADLRADQEAQRARQRRLGQAIGAGVVEGLWVTIADTGDSGEPPALNVTGGLALNRKGQTLEIAKESEIVRLVIPAETTSADAGLFADCQQTPTGVTASGEGLYLLVLSPASGFRERAPMSGLGKGTGSAGCGSRWAVEGVQLRLEPWSPLDSLQNRPGQSYDSLRSLFSTLQTTPGVAALSRLRNLLAHLCLGTHNLFYFPVDPFARIDGRPAFTHYGAVDDLAAAGRLTDCDVPLALVYWTLGGLRFVDNWAVRRRPMPPSTSPDWPSLFSARRRSEAEAVLFQFQNHGAEVLANSSAPTQIQARSYFQWLPPVGLVPHNSLSRRGIEPQQFFAGLTRPANLLVDGAALRPLLSRALEYPPLSLDTGTTVQTYTLRENQEIASDLPVVVFSRNLDLVASTQGSTSGMTSGSGTTSSSTASEFDSARFDLNIFAA